MSSPGKSVLAVLGGYAVMAVVVMGSTVVLQILAPVWIAPRASPGAAYVLLNLGYSCAAAAAGGYAAAWMAPHAPMKHAFILAGVVFVLAIVSAVFEGNQQPRWYQVLLALCTPGAIVLGGRLRSSQAESLPKTAPD